MFRRYGNPIPLGTIFLAALTGAGATAGSVLMSDAVRKNPHSQEQKILTVIVSALSLAAISIIDRHSNKSGFKASYTYHEEVDFNCN